MPGVIKNRRRRALHQSGKFNRHAAHGGEVGVGLDDHLEAQVAERLGNRLRIVGCIAQGVGRILVVTDYQRDAIIVGGHAGSRQQQRGHAKQRNAHASKANQTRRNSSLHR